MKNFIILIIVSIIILCGCMKPQEKCWICTTAYKNLEFKKQYCDYTPQQIKSFEGSNIIFDTNIIKTIDTLYWVISVYDSMPSILNPAIDTFYLVKWTNYNRTEWNAHPEIHNYWKYGKRQQFGVLEVKRDTITTQYTKFTTCNEWKIN
jgi:hypothetical protein